MNDTDLERALSDALHTVTPEPPTAYRFTPSSPSGAETAELVDVVVLDDVRRRRRPYGALLAAAAVVVLGGGIAFAAIAGSHSDSDTTPAAPDRSAAPASTVARCGEGDLLIGMPGKPVIGAGTVVVSASQKNIGTRTCTLGKLPTVTLASGDGTAGGTASFPAVITATKDELVLGAGDSLVFTARLQSAGMCRGTDSARDVAPGLQLEYDGNGYQLDLPIRGCTLTPVGLTVRTVR